MSIARHHISLLWAYWCLLPSPIVPPPLCPQGHRQEIITGLKDAAKDMLIGFYRSNSGRKPLALIYYRDGVAEGQFDEVLREEYKALRQVSQHSWGDGGGPNLE